LEVNGFKKLNSLFYYFSIYLVIISDKGEAHLLFDDLKEKTAEAYCSMIKGMAKVSLYKRLISLKKH